VVFTISYPQIRVQRVEDPSVFFFKTQIHYSKFLKEILRVTGQKVALPFVVVKILS